MKFDVTLCALLDCADLAKLSKFVEEELFEVDITEFKFLLVDNDAEETAHGRDTDDVRAGSS